MTGDISADMADWFTTEGDAMTHDEYEAGQDADGERRMQRALDDEHEARQAAVSRALSEPLHVTNWRPLLAPEDVARLIDTAAALRAENERLRVVIRVAIEHVEHKGWRSADVLTVLYAALRAAEAENERLRDAAEVAAIMLDARKPEADIDAWQAKWYEAQLAERRGKAAGTAPAGDGGAATGAAEGRGDDGAQGTCSNV
jgi:hypothetical protein